MRVTIFYNVVAAKPQETELDKIAYMMQFSQEICARTQTYRQYLGWGKKEKAKKIKITRFPAFCPSAIMYDGKARQNVMGLTDLCFLDIDHVENDKKIEEALNRLRKDKNVVMASKSVSGKGLHILIRYRLKDMETPPQRTLITDGKLQEVYSWVYEYLARKYQYKLELPIDMGAGHMEHLFIISYDIGIYYNPNAEPVMIDLKDTECYYNLLGIDIAWFEEEWDEHSEFKAMRIARMRWNMNTVIQAIRQQLQEAEYYIAIGDCSSAIQTLKGCLEKMAKNWYIKAKKKANWDRWIIRINDMRTQIKDLKELYQMTDEEREAFFSKNDVAKTLYQSYSNHQIIITVENMLKEVESDIKIDDRVAVIEKLLLCKKLVWKIACPFKTRLREEYQLRLEKLQDKAQDSDV